MMEEWINRFIGNVEQALIPICFLALVFFITVAVRMKKEELKSNFFDENAFGKQYLISHGIACVYALIYSCAWYFIPANGSFLIAFLMIILFYWFAIKIITIQNAENGGYIESIEDASGVIMYITSVLSPIVFVGIHVLLAVLCFWLCKRNDNDVECGKIFYRRMIDFVEALVAAIVVKIFMPHTFVHCLWINSIVIAIFTLIMPFLNDWLYAVWGLD